LFFCCIKKGVRLKRQFLKLFALIFTVSTGILRADSTPTMSRVYGNQFTPQVADTQTAGNIGQNQSSFGVQSVNSQLLGGYANALQVLSDGTYVVALSAPGVNSVLAKYNAEGTIVSSSFGTDGVADLGSATLTSRAMMLDTQNRIVVAGGDASGTAGWLKRVSADGHTVQTFSTGSSWQYIGGLAQQSTGKIITVGFNGTNAQIGRYTIGSASAAGAIDTTFGSSGFVAFNGSGSLPAVTTALLSVSLDSSDRIYVAFIATGGTGFTATNAYIARFTAAGAFDTTWGTSGVLGLSALNAATSGLYLAQDATGNFIVGSQITSSNIIVTGVTSSGGLISGFTNFNSSSISADSFAITNILTTSDGSIFVFGSDTDVAIQNMAIIKLTSAGALDIGWNSTGYTLFTGGGVSRTASFVQAGSIAPNGQLYTAGYETNSGVTVPYVSLFYNTQYVSQVAQWPAVIEQGILDQTFGTTGTETYAGVTMPFNGLYGSSMMQRVQSMVEVTTTSGAGGTVPAVGDIIVGMNGKTNTSNSSNMMLSWLTPAGVVDTAAANSGYLTLANSLTNEYLTSILQGPSGLVYVAGYASATDDGASTGALLRAYSSSSTTNWTSGVAAWSVSVATANYQGLGVGYQASATRALLFVGESSTVGHITAYNSSGALDTSWGASASGTISAISYGLNMGPVYGGLITGGDDLIVAYKDSSSGLVNCAMFVPDGSALQTVWGTSGVSTGLFSGATTVAANNIRIAFSGVVDIDNDIIVAAINGAGTSLLVTLLDAATGVVDTTFGTSGVLTVAVTGATSLQLKEVVGISDGMALITFYDNATDDTMYLARITAAGALDTTFNSQGSQPGILPIQIGDRVTNYNARVAIAALVQSTAGANQGNIVVAGYESVTSSDATPMVMRAYGTLGTTEIPFYPVTDTAIPGTFDTAYNENTLLGTAAAKVVYSYPGGNAYQGYMLVGYDNGTTSKIARIDISTNTLDSSFGTAGIYTILGSLNGISTLSIDANNKILVGGTTSGNTPWAQQLSADGASPISFTMPTSGSFAITQVNQILQQKSGRYIVAGSGMDTSASAIGVVMAFQDKLVSPATSLVVDPTFNPLAVGLVTAGTFVVNTTLTAGTPGVYSIAINSDDTILAVYKNITSVMAVAKIAADASGLVSSGFGSATFGTLGTLLTSIVPDGSAVCRVAIDSSNNVVVAASCGSGTTIKIVRYDATGTTSQFANGGIVSGNIATITNAGSAGVTLSDMMQTSTQQTVLLGYNSAGGNGRLFAARLGSNGQFSSTWNPSPSGTDTAGILTFATNSMTVMNGSSICIDGTIVGVGQQVTGTAGDPIVIYVYGDTYVTQVAQNPLESLAGTLDSTIPGGSIGSAATASVLTGVPQKVAILNNNSNGVLMIASSNGTNSYVTKLNADLTLGSYGTSGVATLSAQTSVNDMYVTANLTSNSAAPIYVTGSQGGAMWAAQLNASGTTVTYVASDSGLTAGNVIRQTTNGRILVAGYNGSSGAIAAFGTLDSTGSTPTPGVTTFALDTSFGNGSGTGLYTTSVANQIYDMAVDAYDRIYIPYNSGVNTILVKRLLANGTAVDTTFTATPITETSALSSSQIHLALDMTNSQLVVAVQDGTGVGNIIKVRRFSTVDGSATGSIDTVTLAGKVLNLSDLFIDDLQNIYVIGYNSTDNYSVVARIASTSSTTIALDTNYAATSTTPGVASLATGSMTVVTAGAYDPDRRTYLVGSDGSRTGYIARIFGDVYTSEVSEAITPAIVGTIDSTLYPNFTGGIDLSAQTGWSSLSGGFTARAIIENSNGDGTSFIAFSNDVDLYVGKVNADMVPISSFGLVSNGLTNGYTMPVVNSMTLDSAGDIIVAGTNGGIQKVLSFTSAGVLNATFERPSSVESVVGNVVAQQKSGRYLVAGYDGSANGLIYAYKNESAIASSTLPVDPTFGPAANSGYFATGINSAIDDMVIDSQDYIYYVYRVAGTIYLAKLTANGSGLVSAANSPVTFNSGAVVATDISATDAAHIAINAAGNILVGASTASGVQVRLYNGSTGAAIAAAQSVTVTASDVLTKLVGSIASSNEFYGSIYTATPSAIVFAVTSAGLVDTAGFGTAGLATTTVQSPVQTRGLSLQKDGKLVVVGYASPSTNHPILLRFYGYPYASEYAQEPDLIAAGNLDTTLWPTVGALPLSSYTPITSIITTLSGSLVARIYEYSDGKALILFTGTNSGLNCVLARVNKDLTLDTSFNTTGYVTIIGKVNASTLFIDSDENIYVAGGTTTSWIRAYTSAGATKTGWSTPTSNLSAGAYQVVTQSNDRVILAGKNSNGILYGYNTAGSLDSSFGSSGVVDMGSTAAITGCCVDQYDNIITIKTSAGSTVLQKVSASGLTVTTLSGGTAISSAIGNAKVILDQSGNIIVATATSTGFTLRRYNNDATGTNNGSAVTITLASAVLGNLYATSDGKVVMVGYQTASPYNIVVARLTSAFALDTTTFNASTGYLSTAIGSLQFQANDAFICADNRIMIGGYDSVSTEPYLARVFGDAYVSYVSQGQSQGVAGTLDTTFGNTTPPTGQYAASTLNAILTGAQGKAIFPISHGGYYAAFDNANTAANSILIKTLANGALDTSYNPGGVTPGIAGTTGTYAPLGVNSMLLDGASKMLLVGTTSGAGWAKRYTSAGVVDTFGTSGQIAIGASANVAVEQTLARYVVAGGNGAGGALFAFTSINPSGTPGSIDTTFNSTGLGDTTGGTTPGIFKTNTTYAVFTLVADVYDRLIYSVLNNAGNAVDLYRLTPSGQYDVTFGTGGKVTGALSLVSSASQIRVALDAAGNIIVAATSSTANTFSVVAYDNGTSTVSGANGAAVYAQLNITSLTNTPVVTGLTTSADGYALVVGTQSGTNNAWIARITAGGALDSSAFNPAAIGGVAGIFQYSTGTGTTAHVYNGVAVMADGTLSMVGYENSTGTYVPTIVAVYNDPYTSQESQSPDSKAVGSFDLTLGVNPTWTSSNKGITFFGSGSSASYGQVAEAIALYDDNNILVAMDGGNATSANSSIFLNTFDNDGILNPNFGTAGQATVLQGSASPTSPNYQNQYVTDMVTFTTAAGVHKALLAGYVQNTTLGTYDSLLLQYITTPGANALDTANFGGYAGSPAGIAFGDGKQAFVVGQQSTGRIVVGGLSQDNLGLLLGYTSTGKLDNSFGNSGYQSTNTGTTGIYTHAIDTQNRVVIAYNNGSNAVAVARFLADGSGLDTSFTSPTAFGVISGNTNLKVAVDSSNQVYAGAINTSNSLLVNIYLATGGASPSVTGTITATQLGNASGVYTLTKLIVDAQGNTIAVMYDTNLQQVVVARLTSALILDTTFNTTGYIRYAVADATTSNVATDAMIHPDGRILVVGSEA
jgi:uncharacterized delta-60 repeat protein